MIRAVFFDAGATLLHPRIPVEEVYAREFEADGARFSPEELSRALTRAWEEVHAEKATDRYRGVRGEPDFWRAFLKRVRGFLDGGDVSVEAFERLVSHFRDPGFLGRLRRRPSGRRRARRPRDTPCRRLQLGLSPARASARARPRAPVPRDFGLGDRGDRENRSRRSSCAPARASPSLPPEALHVGDSLAEDYEGARAAGLRALLLDREDRHPHVEDRIRSLREVPLRF